MKKIVLLLLLSGMANAILGQDTVRYQDPWYLFNPMPPLCDVSLSDTNSSHRPSYLTNKYYFLYNNAHIYMEYCSEFDTLYGIAVTCTRMLTDLTAPQYGNYAMLFRNLRYTYVGNNGIIMVTQGNCDTINCGRAPLMKQCKFEYEYGNPSPNYAVTNCYEFFFDEPIIGSGEGKDTIYVGLWGSLDWWNSEFPVAGIDSSFSQNILINGSEPFHPFAIPFMKIDSSVVEPQYKQYRQLWGLAFPIIGLRCTAPRGLRVNRVDSLYTAVWNEDEDAELFQLSMCTGGQMPEDGNIVTVSGHSYDLGGWMPDSTHHLYLRKQCDYSTPSHSRQVWSDWSRMPDPEPEPEEADTNGINAVATLAMELVPNPAQERVTVRCAQAEGGTVSVVDMQGRTLLTQAAQATTVLDISTLPDGPYLVRIVTPTGTATRKLSVVR